MKYWVQYVGGKVYQIDFRLYYFLRNNLLRAEPTFNIPPIALLIKTKQSKFIK